MIEEPLPTPYPEARRRLVEVLARAFLDNPMNRAIHGPRPGRRLRANRAGLRALVEDTAFVLEARIGLEGRELLGGLVAAPPDVRVLPAPAPARQLGCLWHQGPRAVGRWGRVAGAFLQRRPLLPHWYLAVLGIDPVAQGRGAGSSLLRAWLNEIERSTARDGTFAPVYLECDRPASVAFYRRHGFEVLFELELEGVVCWGMGYGFQPDR
jgi:ribosomal protein S18 acetylase RimI-like enzyme